MPVYELTEKTKIGVLGGGTMGLGIAQIAASNGHDVYLYDNDEWALEEARQNLSKTFDLLIEKNDYTKEQAKEILSRIRYSDFVGVNEQCGIVFEAIVEKLRPKQEAFRKLEKTFSENTILATNTSSISVTAIASICEKSERVLGSHFFYPATVVPLVEIVPGLTTSDEVINKTRGLLNSWKKVTVLSEDRPGFIINRVSRPFYTEALRILEEGIANISTIDWAMKNFGNFQMGPFEMMDLTGNDENFHITKTLFKQFYYDRRFKPSFIQKQLVDGKYYGRKTEKGFYDYSDKTKNPEPDKSSGPGQKIFNRILAMLINEAAEIVFMKVASAEDVDTAVKYGLDFPKGLFEWADATGVTSIVDILDELHSLYNEDRYRANHLLLKMKRENRKFY